MKHDSLYDNFRDPSCDFNNEPRAFCYNLATKYIDAAKKKNTKEWYRDKRIVKGVLLLLFTWNFAARETKKLNFKNVGKLIEKNEARLRTLEKYTIETANQTAWPIVKSVFSNFKGLMGQTGASKALSLLNPKLFVMWDTKIRRRLRKTLIPGIENGESPKHYVIYLKGIQRIIYDYQLKQKLPPRTIVAKKIDEYNYVKIVMNKKRV